MAYRLTPLIYSGGPDGESAMHIAGETIRISRLILTMSTHDDYQAGDA